MRVSLWIDLMALYWISILSQVDCLTLALSSSSLCTVFSASLLISSHSFSPSSTTLCCLATSMTNSSRSSRSISVTRSFSAKSAFSLSLICESSPTSCCLKACLAASWDLWNSSSKISLKTLIWSAWTRSISGSYLMASPRLASASSGWGGFGFPPTLNAMKEPSPPAE